MERIRKGIYRHFKGKKYRVLGTARHSESLEKFVVYRALYSSPEFGDIKNNPMISKKTVQELIQKKVRIIGMDALTPDDLPFSLHKELFRRGILIVENLVNLEPLNGKRFECIILPLNIRHGDGAPCRVVGILRE